MASSAPGLIQLSLRGQQDDTISLTDPFMTPLRIAPNRRSKLAHTSRGTGCMATLLAHIAHPWARAWNSGASRWGRQAENS